MAELIESPNLTSEPTPWTEISHPSVLAQIPLVSVGMISYNHAPYIAQAIEGVLQQETNFPIELVIGEDCSTDCTREIILAFKNKYPNIIRVITSERNVGANNNSNRVIKSCRGKYIAFCEGDDYWIDRLKLQKQVDQLENNPKIVVSAHRAYTVDVNGNIINTFPAIQSKLLKPKDFIVKYGGFIASNSMMMRNELFVNIPPWFYEFPVGDCAIMNLCVQRGEIGFINDIMSAYRKGVSGSWTSRQNENWKKAFMFFVNIDRAYRHLISQEKKYTYLYYTMRMRGFWIIIKILISRFIKRPIRSILMPSKKVPPASDL
jgi:glycosyltransferase involved in cell wall biosynthesis